MDEYDHKMKVFLIHRKEILQTIRTQSNSEGVLENMNKKRVKKIVENMYIHKVCKMVLFWF